MRPNLLRPLLALDAATCLAMGAGLLALSTRIVESTGLPAPIVTGAGWILLPCAALMAAMALRPVPVGIALIVAGNAAWVAASLAVVVLAGANALGMTLVLAQAFAVLVIAALEWTAWKASASNPHGVAR